MRRVPVAAAVAAATISIAGCSTGTASYDDARSLKAPTFAATPSSPAESPQLDALVLRDTAGLEAVGPNADPTILVPALAALTAEFPDTARISDLYFDEENVWLTIVDPQSPNRSRSIYWSDYHGLSVGEAEFMEEDTSFPISAVHVDAITALVEGLAVIRPS